jgi:mono/diheme cytochrome c family protein
MVGAQDLTDATWQAATTDEQITRAIRTGPKAMPAFAQKLSPSEIDALAMHVRTFKSAQMNPP